MDLIFKMQYNENLYTVWADLSFRWSQFTVGLVLTSGLQVRLVYLQSGSVDITLYTASPDDARKLIEFMVKENTIQTS